MPETPEPKLHETWKGTVVKDDEVSPEKSQKSPIT